MKYRYLVRRIVPSEAMVTVEITEEALDRIGTVELEMCAIEQAKGEDAWGECNNEYKAELWGRVL